MIRRHFFLFAALCVLGLMVVAGGLRLAAASGKDSDSGPEDGATGGRGGGVAVSQAIVALRPFSDSIEVLGVAKGRQSVTITSEAAELITAVRFSDGQFVRKGQVLVDLKAQEQSADLAEAQSSLNLARLQYQRWKSLGDRGVASPAAVDEKRAAMQQAQASLASAQARRGDRTIRAPFSGVVGLTDVAPGALINPGSPIVSLDDVAVMRVDFDVPDRYLGAVREGMQITARPDAFPDQSIPGRIAQLNTRVDERTRALKARAEFPNASGVVRPGMLMKVSIDRGAREAPAAPEAAVLFEADAAFVFVLAQEGPGRLVAQRRVVTTGVRQGGFIEIVEGLRPGERIVADGVNRVQANQPVRLADAVGPRGPGAPGGQRRPAS